MLRMIVRFPVAAVTRDHLRSEATFRVNHLEGTFALAHDHDDARIRLREVVAILTWENNPAVIFITAHTDADEDALHIFKRSNGRIDHLTRPTRIVIKRVLIHLDIKPLAFAFPIFANNLPVQAGHYKIMFGTPSLSIGIVILIKFTVFILYRCSDIVKESSVFSLSLSLLFSSFLRVVSERPSQYFFVSSVVFS